MSGLSDAKVLIVGAGGLGCATGPLLARSGIGQIDVCDDDRIEVSNLHRQLLYQDGDIGSSKSSIFAASLRCEARSRGFTLNSVAREIRVVPEIAVDAVDDYDLVVEGADNFATKFLIADACALAGVPCVQAGAVRWNGWALATLPRASACLRCVFEEIPAGGNGCSVAGVIGPVVGVVGALLAALAIRVLRGEPQVGGELWSFTGLTGGLRVRRIERQRDCPLCVGLITDTDVSRYIPPERAA